MATFNRLLHCALWLVAAFTLPIGAVLADAPAAPVITSFSPASGPPGTTVTIHGENLTGVTLLRFNGVGAVFSGFENGTEGTAVVPALATTGPITINAAGGKASSATSFEVVDNGLPFIDQISPAAAYFGASVEIKGRNLTNAVSVKFNGTEATFNTLADSLVAVVPPAATSGTVTVTTPLGQAVSPAAFTVLTQPPPGITSFNPPQAQPGASVTIRGTNFNGVLFVKFNGVTASFRFFSGILSATVPATATTGPITVATASGTNSTTTDFIVLGTPPPEIADFQPQEGPEGTLVVIDGANLAGVTSVKFGTVTAEFRLLGSSVVATVPVGAASAPITLTTPSGQAVSSKSFSVTQRPPPEITDFSPSGGGPGDEIEIHGTNFYAVAFVRFNGVDAVFTNLLSTVIVATVPTNALSGPITVITATGTNASLVSFSFTNTLAPVLTDVSPLHGAPGSQVALRGSKLTGLTQVAFNGVAATFQVFSDTLVLADVPATASTGPITVTGPNGQFVTEQPFVVDGIVPTPPVLTEVAPLHALPGAKISLKGSKLSGLTKVQFNGLDSVFQVVSDSLVEAEVPASATTGPITVTGPNGQFTTEQPFVVDVPVPTPPVVTEVSPLHGLPGVKISLKGSKLSGLTKVQFNGLDSVFQVVSDSLVEAQVPAKATTGPITVIGPNGQFITVQPFVVDPAQPTNPPSLQLQALAAGGLELSWADDGFVYVVQTRTEVGGGADWADLTLNPVVLAGRRTVALTASEATRFYRLIFK